MTASCPRRERCGGPARALPPPEPWPLLMCTSGLYICPVGGPSGGRRMGCLQSGGPGCGSVDIFDVLNRVLGGCAHRRGDVCGVGTNSRLGALPCAPRVWPWAAGSFSQPCPLAAEKLHCPPRLWSLPGCTHLGGRCGPALLHSSGQRLGICRKKEGWGP